jgi:hypothetical protein
MTFEDTPAYRLTMPDVLDALTRLRSVVGLFVPTTTMRPIGAHCLVEVVAERTRASLRLEAIVVGRRLPAGAGESLMPGVVLRAASTLDAPPACAPARSPPCRVAVADAR